MKISMRLFLIVLTLFGLPVSLSALMPTDDAVRRAESDHFIYIYQASLEHQLPRLIQDCEDAYTLLTPIFQWEPRRKTVVLFSDGFDIHNGWATVFPRPTIMIYAADTPPGSTIYEPGDYLRRTVFHEFTHVLSMDPQFGVDGIFSRIFGRVLPVAGDPLSLLITYLSLPPGAVAPIWFIEGLAMWTETEMVGPGRGRNTLVDMYMRVAAESDRLLPPSQWSLRHPEWPFGNAGYMYGMKAIQYAQETYGETDPERNVVGELSLSAANTMPFWFNQRARPVTGACFKQMALNSVQHEKLRQRERMAHLAGHPFTPLPRLTATDMQVYHPRFDHSGRHILFSGTREEHRDTLYRFDTATPHLSPRRLRFARASGSFSRLAPAPDRESFYYTRLDTPRREQLLSHLYRFDARQQRSHRVTRGGRYRFPALSATTPYLAAVRAEAGQQVLIEVPLSQAGQRRHERIRVTAPPNTTLVDPIYAPDGQTLVYVQADEQSSQLRRLHVDSGVDTVLLEWPAIITSPIFHPDGEDLVFVSDRNGVYNLYRMPYRAAAEPVALTHVPGGIFEPDFSPDGSRLVATAYDADGYYLTWLDYHGIQAGAGELPTLDPTWRPLEMNETRRQAVVSQLQPAPPTRPYRPLFAVRPNFWSPWLNASTDGVQGGLLLDASDPIDRHHWSFIGGYESEHQTPLAAVSLSYSRFEPVLNLSAFNTLSRYDSLLQDTEGIYYDYDEEIGGVAASLTWPLLSIDRSLYVTLGYQWTDSRSVRKTARTFADADLITAPVFTGNQAAGWVQFDYFSATAFRRSHSLEEGRYLSLAIERADDQWGGDLNRTRWLGAWHEYVPLPWGRNHVLKLEGHYGTSDGDRTAQGAFGLGGFHDTIALSTPGVPRSLGLRGYDANTQVGTEVIKAGAAYRFPVFRFYRGAATAPFYMQQIFGELFYEGGQATGGEAADRPRNDWISAVGTELNFSLTVLRWIDIAPGIGLVYAPDRTARVHIDDDDEDDNNKFQAYISLKASVNF
jgi:hypothetical protein